MKKIKVLIFIPIIIIFINLLFNCSKVQARKKTGEDPNFLTVKTKWVDSLMQTMTLDEKIGQLFMIDAKSNASEKDKKKIISYIKKYKPGGICFFKGSPVAQAKLTNYYQSQSKIPMLIAGDYEWGLSMRLDSTVRYPRQMLMGAVQNKRLIYSFGIETGRQLKRMGIHINFAPVIDVNNNPKNPVINSRSFGEQPDNVAIKGTLYMLGLQKMHVMATGKHFPGHGDTNTDSHKALPSILHTKARLDTIETFPFRTLINNGLDAVMVAHLNIPKLDSADNSISSLSKPIVTKYLKNEMNFKGLVFSDALGMKAVANQYEEGETELRAFMAGIDILLMPRDLPIAFEAIKEAIKTGKISKTELNARVKKILKAKKWVNLDKYQPIKIPNLIEDLNTDTANLINRKLTEASITVASDNYGIIPFKLPKGKTVASLSISKKAEINEFQTRMSVYEKIDTFSVSKKALKKEYDNYLQKLKKYDFTIISLHNTNRKPPLFGVTEEAIQLVENLAKSNNVILVVFGNPYILRKLKNPEKLSAVVVSYNDRELTQDITAQVVFGGIKSTGKLPVSAGEYFRVGQGKTTKKIRLKYSTPRELNIRCEKLEKIDSITLSAIENHETPGAVIIAAKDGVVFYRKAFGTHTYQKTQKTKVDDLFDLASLTKILASVPSLMKLQEQKKFNPLQTIGYYLPEAKKTNKANLRLVDVLSHQARLRAWIPFYLHTFKADKKTFKDGIFSSKKTSKFPYKVAKNMYISKNYEDTIYSEIYNSKLLAKKKYRYSDLGYYLIKKIIEKQSGQSINKFTDDNFYESLGAYTMGYNPLTKFAEDKIMPTELDTTFRHQELRGYVHDYGAAMTNGINGHAGLFANADDVSKMLQMFLQKGEYGGEQYLSPEIIKFYSTQFFNPKKNRRALGFDKPKRPKGGPTAQVVSDSSFGHSGFTGTYAWVDPQYNFIYVFLSNRIHPSINNRLLIKNNTRTKIQKLFYEAFLSQQQINEQKKMGRL